MCFLPFQLACCCGTAACSLCCKCCPKIKQSTSTRFMYALYFILVTIICCVMMSTTVANEMKTHVSSRDGVTALPGRKQDSFHSSLCTAVLPQKRQSISSTHPLQNTDGMIFHARSLDFSMLTSSCHPLSMFHNRKSQGLASFLSDAEICCSEPTPGLLCRHCHRREKYWGTCFDTTNQFSLTLIFVSGSLFSSRSSKLENNSSSVAILILPS